MAEDFLIKRIIKGQVVQDGAGVRLNRIIANSDVDHIDPFFLLDEFRSDNPDDYSAGFPMHPHRGIETITYMIKGRFSHKDSRGGGGVLKDGDVQWMTAGKGIEHEEMPAMDQGHLWGYQLWLNLPKKDKWIEPKYQHLKAESIPVCKENGCEIHIISGTYKDQRGPAQNYVPADYFDVRLDRDTTFKIETPVKQNSFIYIHTGSIKIGDKVIGMGNLIEFMAGKLIVIQGRDEKAGLLYLSGKPNNEPYYRGGPFVMNTREEIQQAFEDYRNGKLF